MTITVTDTDIAPARITTQARCGAAFTRAFCATQGEVEVTAGVKMPLAAVDTSVVTTAIATQAYFWAIRASVTIFHAPSQTFVTAQGANFDLSNIAEEHRGLVHEDSFWSTRDPISNSSPSSCFQKTTAALAQHAQGVAKLIDETHISKEETEKILATYVRSGLTSLRRKIEATLSTITL